MAAQGWNPTRQTQLPPHFIIVIVITVITIIVIVIIVVSIIVVLVIVVVPSGELADGRLVCVADHLFVSLHHHHPPHDHLHHPPHDDHHHPPHMMIIITLILMMFLTPTWNGFLDLFGHKSMFLLPSDAVVTGQWWLVG